MRFEYGLIELFSFTPSAKAPFTFQPTLDGSIYTAIIKWNLFGQRYFLNLYTPQGIRVCTVASVGSPNDHDISLVGGYFTSLLVYRTALQQFESLSNPTGRVL